MRSANATWQCLLTERDPEYVGDSDSARAKIIQAWVRDIGFCNVLDIGCADGALLSCLTKQHTITGVDVSPVNLAKAKRHGYADAIVHDCEQGLPFEAGKFGAVVATEILEHVIDTDYVLSEIRRVLCPLGRLLVSVPNVRTPIGLAMLVAGLPPMFAARYQRGHVRDWTKRLIVQALLNNGFNVVQVLGGGMTLPNGKTIMGRAMRHLPGWSSTILCKSIKVGV